LSSSSTLSHEILPAASTPRRRFGVVALLGVMTILTYGTSYYLLTVLAPAIVAETGWPLALVIGGLSLGLLVSGLAAPWVGRRIEALGGRAVLPAGCAVLAAGLALLGAADALWLYALAWIVLGLGMAATLYDAAFATLGRQYGLRARALITLLTLFGGFASTICWPLSALLVEALDWRGACFVYAGLLLALALPLRLCLAPPPPHLLPGGASPAGPPPRLPRDRVRLLLVLGFCFALSATITTVLSVHLVALLGAREVALAGAVAYGTLIGPSQVGGRVIEYAVGRRVHPLWTLVASTLPMALGLTLLALGWGWIALSLVLYGGGVGVKSIAAGTVPLALVGQRGYAVVMGRLAAPSLIMQALAPVAAARYLEGGGGAAAQLWWVLAGSAMLNLVLSLWLLAVGRRTAAAS
jgi:hypothetical protein